MQSKFLIAVSFILLAGSGTSAFAGSGQQNNGSTSFTLDSTAFFGGEVDDNLDVLLVSASGNITGNVQNGNIPTGWSVLVDGSASNYPTNLFQVNETPPHHHPPCCSGTVTLADYNDQAKSVMSWTDATPGTQVGGGGVDTEMSV